MATGLPGIDYLASLFEGPGAQAAPAANYEALKRRRDIAAALASKQRAFPKTMGEGMTYFGESMGELMNERRLAQMEKEQRAAEGGVPTGAPAPQYVPGGAPAPRAPAPAVAPAPRAAAPAAPPITPVTTAPAPSVPIDPGLFDPNPMRGKIAAEIVNQAPAVAAAPAPQEVAQPNPTIGGADAPLSDTLAMSQAPGGPVEVPEEVKQARRDGIGGIEAGGTKDPYRALGRTTRDGDRGFGKYQVMGKNIPSWTEEAIGRRMTPEEFLANEKAQDDVFDWRFGNLAGKYGEEGAARAWYAGEKGMKNLNATDINGRLTVGGYGQTYMSRFNRATGKRADAEGGELTTKFAALAPTGATMSDAPPIGAGVLPRPPVSDEEENPPTITDIQPMPRSVRTQTAQIGPGVIPGSVAAPGGFVMGPNQPPLPASPAGPGGAVAAPSRPPSKEDIPPQPVEQPPELSPEPKRPDVLGPSKAQQYWQQFMNNPRYSPELQARAAREYQAEEKYRTEIQSRQAEEYKDLRELHQQQKVRRETWDREKDVRDLTNRLHRLSIEEAIAKAENRPLDRAKLQNEIEIQKANLEEARYKIGIPREQERRKGELHIQESERKLAAPETKEIDGVLYERTPATPGTPPGLWQVSPGSPKKEKLTEKQANTLTFFQRSNIAASQMGDTAVLAGLADTGKGKVPIAGNYWVSPEYQRAKNAADAWLLATIRNESGAVIGVHEIPQFYPTFFPIPGDTEARIAEKAVRRKQAMQSMYDSLGDAKAPADAFIKERAGRKTDKPEGTIQENKNTGKRRRVIGGHWEDMD